jgi:hypothetical protein
MAPTLFEGAGDASRLLALLVVLATVHWVRVLSRRLAALEAAASTEVKQPLPSGSSDPDLTATPQPGSRNTLYGQTAAEATAGVRPADFTFPPGDCRRFGADPSGKADSTMAINTALRVPGETVLCEGMFMVSTPIRLRSYSSLVGVGSGSYDQHDAPRGSQIRPSAAFHGAAVVILDPATEGKAAYINGVGLRGFWVDMMAVTQRKLIGIQVLSAADPSVFLDLKVMNQDTGHFVYVGESANAGALQSEGVVFDCLLCLSNSIDPPNADAGIIVEASNEIHFKNGKVSRRSNRAQYPGSVGLLVRPSASGVTVNDLTSSQMAYAGWETGNKVVSSSTAGQGPRWIRCNYCMFEGPRYGFAVFGAEGRPSQFCSAIGNRMQTTYGDQPAVIYVGDYCCNGTFEQDEEPGYHPSGAGPQYTVFCTEKSEANTVRASPHSGVSGQGIGNLIFGRDPSGALSVATLSARTIAAQTLQKPPALTNGWVQYSATNRSAVGFWLDPMHCVHLQGHVASGELHEPVFTLPVGLRPAKDKTFAVAGAPSKGGGASVVRISQAGAVCVDAGSNAWLSIDGVSFRAGD